MQVKGKAQLLDRTSATPTAVLFDPYPIWHEAVERTLEADIQVVGKATTCERALELVCRYEPHVLVTELEGIDCFRQARAAVPELRAVVFSAAGEPEDVIRAFEAGASTYVLKTSEPRDLVVAVRQSFTPTLFLANAMPKAEPTPGDSAERERLTARERETLALVAEGRSNKEIARTFWVTEQTVKFHLSNTYRKLNVSNRTEAARWCHLNMPPLRPGDARAEHPAVRTPASAIHNDLQEPG